MESMKVLQKYKKINILCIELFTERLPIPQSKPQAAIRWRFAIVSQLVFCALTPSLFNSWIRMERTDCVRHFHFPKALVFVIKGQKKRRKNAINMIEKWGFVQ